MKITSIIAIVCGAVLIGFGAWMTTQMGSEVPTVPNTPEPSAQEATTTKDTTPTAVDNTTGVTPNTESANSPTPSTYTLSDVVKHATPDDCWTTVDGVVYDLTPFVQKHPGGVRDISKICGTDGTSAFSREHGDDGKANAMLDSLSIGNLAQ
jgi:cytochrome b involved in lipid metabolism